MTSKTVQKLGSLLLSATLVLMTIAPTWAKDAAQYLEEAAHDFGQGKYGSAARNYRKALKLDPRQPHAYLGLSMALKSEGDLDESEAVLRELIQLYPDFAAAHYNLGEVLEAKGDMPGAKSAYADFIRHSGGRLPNQPEIRIKFRKMGLL